MGLSAAAPQASFDAILVLGAAQLPDGSPGPAIRRRVRHAVSLYQEGKAPCLVMAGGPTSTPMPEADTMAQLARDEGIPEAAIHCERQSTRTLENAVCSRDMMAAQGWRRVLLVTDAAHMPRALYTFRAFGLDVTPAPVAMPRSLTTLALVLRETVARICYLWSVRQFLAKGK